MQKTEIPVFLNIPRKTNNSLLNSSNISNGKSNQPNQILRHCKGVITAGQYGTMPT
jgi:hypothetical protein